jgi:hypothetical protein
MVSYFIQEYTKEIIQIFNIIIFFIDKYIYIINDAKNKKLIRNKGARKNSCQRKSKLN